MNNKTCSYYCPKVFLCLCIRVVVPPYTNPAGQLLTLLLVEVLCVACTAHVAYDLCCDEAAGQLNLIPGSGFRRLMFCRKKLLMRNYYITLGVGTSLSKELPL